MITVKVFGHKYIEQISYNDGKYFIGYHPEQQLPPNPGYDRKQLILIGWEKEVKTLDRKIKLEKLLS